MPANIITIWPVDPPPTGTRELTIQYAATDANLTAAASASVSGPPQNCILQRDATGLLMQTAVNVAGTNQNTIIAATGVLVSVDRKTDLDGTFTAGTQKVEVLPFRADGRVWRFPYLGVAPINNEMCALLRQTTSDYRCGIVKCTDQSGGVLATNFTQARPIFRVLYVNSTSGEEYVYGTFEPGQPAGTSLLTFVLG
jgi:hypothetical protein